MRITIPEFYVLAAKNSQNPKQTFKRYVDAYLVHNYNGYYLVKWEQREAIIEKK
ncbi:hypothetical protein [Salipaludibacillus sp. CF4.18]|uniref:hypothetical protein n=1 Tax=Salipaludibacillus sp. CF4.18 TaxID=3373081 RepID=UPI003EE7009F